MAAVYAGVPLIIWHRQDCHAKEFQSAVDYLLHNEDDENTFLERVRRARAAAFGETRTHPCGDLAVLYDDPMRRVLPHRACHANPPHRRSRWPTRPSTCGDPSWSPEPGGTGKSALAYLIARELGLGPVLRRPITSKTVAQQGLFLYDAIARVQASNAAAEVPDIGDYIHLGPLGTGLLPAGLPRVLLIDELDKGDIDLPNDLLDIFEEGEYQIPELVRYAKTQPEVTVLTNDIGHHGHVQCREFPVVVITSNGEREFPPAFLRRCPTLELEAPDHALDVHQLIDPFQRRAAEVGPLAPDQLLNAVNMAVRLATAGNYNPDGDWASPLAGLWHPLSAEHG